MKRKFILIAVMLLTLVMFVGCERLDSEKNKNHIDNVQKEKNDEVFIIREKFFIDQINDIFFNIEDYEGKVLRVEGMYSVFTTVDETEKVPVVYRNGPGCCENDGWAGFLLNYSGTMEIKENDWIEVEGTPEVVVKGLYQDLYLNVTKITIKEQRGAEFVTH